MTIVILEATTSYDRFCRGHFPPLELPTLNRRRLVAELDKILDGLDALRASASNIQRRVEKLKEAHEQSSSSRRRTRQPRRSFRQPPLGPS